MTPAQRGTLEALGITAGSIAVWLLYVRPSPNFTWDEWTTTETGLRNTPALKDRIEIVAASWGVLEKLREYSGPLRITSGHRSHEVNEAVGGSATSDHAEDADGAAADIYDWDGDLSHEDLASWLYENRDRMGLLDQVIVERHTGHLHIGTRLFGARAQFLQTDDGVNYEGWTP